MPRWPKINQPTLRVIPWSSPKLAKNIESTYLRRFAPFSVAINIIGSEKITEKKDGKK